MVTASIARPKRRKPVIRSRLVPQLPHRVLWNQPMTDHARMNRKKKTADVIRTAHATLIPYQEQRTNLIRRKKSRHGVPKILRVSHVRHTCSYRITGDLVHCFSFSHCSEIVGVRVAHKDDGNGIFLIRHRKQLPSWRFVVPRRA